MTKTTTTDKATATATDKATARTKKNNIPQFTIRQMLESGVHFGHRSMRRNPKMSKYIYGQRNGLNIIDLRQTGVLLHNALKVIKGIAENNGRILFVATKKQAFEIVAQAAKRCGQYYVNHRWLGGMLTNWKTVSKSIKTLRQIEEQLADKESDLNKKEKLMLERKRMKLEMALGGIRDMGGYPDLVFIIDTNREALAVAEAQKIGIPIMAVLDTNSNPDNITYPIPGNDDSIKAIKLYCHLVSDAILTGIKENMASSGVVLNKIQNVSEQKILKIDKKSSKEVEAKEVKKVVDYKKLPIAKQMTVKAKVAEKSKSVKLDKEKIKKTDKKSVKKAVEPVKKEDFKKGDKKQKITVKKAPDKKSSAIKKSDSAKKKTVKATKVPKDKK